MSGDKNLPAFPSSYSHEDGMTLRDYFAAKAMHACWANECNRQRALEDSRGQGHTLYEQLAIEAYEVADAMLKARAK